MIKSGQKSNVETVTSFTNTIRFYFVFDKIKIFKMKLLTKKFSMVTYTYNKDILTTGFREKMLLLNSALIISCPCVQKTTPNLKQAT